MKKSMKPPAAFLVLSYSAEISETLNLDPGDIFINQPKEVFFWSQHFLNPSNDEIVAPRRPHRIYFPVEKLPKRQVRLPDAIQIQPS